MVLMRSYSFRFSPSCALALALSRFSVSLCRFLFVRSSILECEREDGEEEKE